MVKSCDFCNMAFIDGEAVTAIVTARFKLIPSRVNYALSVPEGCQEMYHPECFEEFIGELA